MFDYKIIDAAFQVSEVLEKIGDKHVNIERGKKQGFNFFEGLVGDRVHLEKYHTNFISYLLSSEGHGCEHLFLKCFLEMLVERCNKKPDDHKLRLLGLFLDEVKRGNCVEVGKERQLSSGQIDIELIFSGLGGALFIENKVRSWEGHNQVSGYFGHYETAFPDRHLGIFLTKDGGMPPSIDPSAASFGNLILLSYRDIIEWLEASCTERELLFYPHIVGCLLQYIHVVKKELNIMEEKEKKEMLDFLERNPGKLSLLVKNQSRLSMMIQQAVEHNRAEFLEDIKHAVERFLGNKEYQPQRNEAGRFLCHYDGVRFLLYIEQAYPELDDGGKGLWWGVYDENGAPFKFHIGLAQQGWEAVIIDQVNDFNNDEEGSAKIIESSRDSAKRKMWIEDIVHAIEERIGNIVLPAIKKREIN